jgi:putative FmdB family regulatory protein
MPIYEYRCEKCGEFEHTQRITESALQRCPTCKRKVRRLISNTSFQLKGSGWYVTDYARAGSGKDKKDDKKETSGDTAPATAGGGEGASTAEGGKSESSKAEGSKSEKSETSSPASSKPAASKAPGKAAGGKPARASA